jgi:hypothetical protein
VRKGTILRWNRRWIPGVALGLLLACVLLAVLLMGLWPDRAPAIDDSRACPGSNVNLGEATAHFGVTIPSDATDVRFSADVHPMFGEYSLVLGFHVTPEGLGTFLRGTGLPSPSASFDPTLDIWDASCGLIPGSSGRLVSTRDQTPSGAGNYQRAAVIDMSNRAKPYVLVAARDL